MAISTTLEHWANTWPKWPSKVTVRTNIPWMAAWCFQMIAQFQCLEKQTLVRSYLYWQFVLTQLIHTCWLYHKESPIALQGFHQVPMTIAQDLYFKRQTSINTAWPIKVAANSFRDKQKTLGYPCNTTSWIFLGCDHCCIGWGRLCQCEGSLFCRRHWQAETWIKYNKILMPNQNFYQANQEGQEWKLLIVQREKLGEACKHEIANTGFPMISVWNVSIWPPRLWIRPQRCVPSDQKVQHQKMACRRYRGTVNNLLNTKTAEHTGLWRSIYKIMKVLDPCPTRGITLPAEVSPS